MQLLITGAAGFIGSHVVEEVVEHGHTVKALVHYNSESRIGNLRYLDLDRWRGKVNIIFGDVCDARFMLEAAKGCEGIVHMAALIGIPYSYVAPQSYLMTNVHGTLNVLEAARELAIQRIIVTSTSEVYGTALYTPIDEAHPLQAQSPYSASKIAADKLAESYGHSFGLPVVIVRPFNTYGPRQSARAVIPTILSQLIAGSPIVYLGSQAPKRDLVYVKDTARAFRLALESSQCEYRTIHFGTGRAISVAEVARMCLEVTGSQAEIVTDPARIRPEKSEVGLLLADSRRAKEVLNWTPMVQLEEGLKATAKFARDHGCHVDVQRYTI